MFHFSQTTRSIRFVCPPEDHGVIAPPVAAKTVLPDWFRKLPPVDSQPAVPLPLQAPDQIVATGLSSPDGRRPAPPSRRRLLPPQRR
ncbi:hypothetical protein IHQ72_19805 [Mesorhizobium onobrychidis]|uniref:Lytic murein transglycosylase n=1 Tax=Mesorhizobium onobrychidis TaxID=2775404 RepID=A0ABY5R8Y3_9HYPH|nr:hypothetical protein [Mesorhizobium onobrychidis]UVC19271.1 hypothetical protein IHQ72_19805 [Mesorhizobium onobrychidis]